MCLLIKVCLACVLLILAVGNRDSLIQFFSCYETLEFKDDCKNRYSIKQNKKNPLIVVGGTNVMVLILFFLLFFFFISFAPG